MPTAAPEIIQLARPPYYNPFGRLMRRWFGESVFKLTLDAGFTCPNIDGTRATGGCTFCDNVSFSPALRTGVSGIRDQLERGKGFYRHRFGARRFIAYFQTFTNTYAPIERLKRLYDEALDTEDIVGIAIGTRPDCVDTDILRLIQGYADGSAEVWRRRVEAGRAEHVRPFVSIEYGMQTMHDETAWRVNRAHTHAETVAAVELTRLYSPDAHLCLHLIAGLPGEDDDKIRASSVECARLNPDSIKFHHCYVFENTVMAREYAAGEFEAPRLEQHVARAADCLELLPPRTYVQRLVGEVNDGGVVAPRWGVSKLQVYRMVNEELARRGSCQGRAAEGH
jgi:uncharacterized protein